MSVFPKREDGENRGVGDFGGDSVFWGVSETFLFSPSVSFHLKF
jgi:hypothetical protein